MADPAVTGILRGSVDYDTCDSGCIVAEGIALGSLEAAEDAAWLRARHVTHIASIGCPARCDPEIVPIENRLLVEISDMEEENLLGVLPTVLRFLRDARANGGVTLVHCRFGQSRSVSCVIAWLMHGADMSLHDAARLVAARRPCVYVNDGFIAQLIIFARMGARCRLKARHFAVQCALGRPPHLRAAFLRAVAGSPGPATPAPPLRRRFCCARCRHALAPAASGLFACTPSLVPRESAVAQQAPPTAVAVEPLAWMCAGGAAGAPTAAGAGDETATFAPAEPSSAARLFAAARNGKLHCPACGAKVGAFAEYAPIMRRDSSMLELSLAFWLSLSACSVEG